MKPRMKALNAAAVLALIGLTACGSSISGPGISGPNPVRGSGGSATTVVGTFPAFQSDMNNARKGPGLNPLSYNAKLAAAAQAHANDMSTNGFFDHVGSDGSTFGQRIRAQGYNYAWAGENIAWGYASEAALFAAWMNSPGHRANILSAEPTEFGLALAPGNYWVLELARPLP